MKIFRLHRGLLHVCSECLQVTISWGDPHMRAAMAIVISILTLGLGSGLVHAETEYRILNWIHMFDALTGWAVIDGGNGDSLLRTTDGGGHWKDVTPLDSSWQNIPVNPYCFDVLTSLIAWVGPFRTVDSGLTWRTGTVPPKGWPPPGAWQSMSFINSRDGWLISWGGANRGSELDVSRSTDGGDNWIIVASTSADNQSSGLPWPPGGIGGITFVNATTGWITGETDVKQLFLYVTHDGGRTWQRQIVPLPSRVISQGHGDTRTLVPGFFTAQDGILPALATFDLRPSLSIFYVTHDGGTTWTYTTPISVQPITLSNTRVPASSFVDVNHGWMTDGYALYVTSDGGRQWTIESPSSIAKVKYLDFISLQVGWAASEASPFLLKTVDGGHTWAPVTFTVSRQ